MRVKVSSGTKLTQAPAVQLRTNGSKPLVNAFWSNDSIVLVHPDRTVSRVSAKFSLFVKADQVQAETTRQLKGSRAVKSITKDGDWLRIECPDLDYRAKICKWLENEQKVETYEGDLNPVRRYMIDAEPAIVAPRHCFIDIETDSRVPFSRKEEMRLLVVSIVDGVDWDKPELPHSRRRVILAEDTDEAEIELLKQVWVWLLEYQQVIAWAGDRFDFELLVARTKARGLRVPFKRWLWLDHMELFRRMNISAAESGDEKQSMKLNDIAMQVCGEGKHEFDASKTWEAWAAGGAERIRLADYCDQDTLLMPKIEAETGYIALLGTLCEVTGTFPDTRGVSPQQQVEAFMLTLAKKQNYKPRTREQYGQQDAPQGKFQGAFVMQPKARGIERNVHVCDFASMYPSIILTWNMSPETKVGVPPDPNMGRPNYLARVPLDPLRIALSTPDQAIAAGTDVIFRQSVTGILPIAIAELIRLRKYWNDKKSAAIPGTDEWKEYDRRSTAYKIAGNSFYGVMGSPTSRFFDREVAESVTLSGVWLIQETIKEAEARGMKCIYGDTDSVFIVGVTQEEFQAFVDYCNKTLYPRLVLSRGCLRNTIKLAYEKEFSRLVMVTAKRYCGIYRHYKGTLATEDSKPEIRGLEYKRGDVARLARTMQAEAIDLLMKQRVDTPEQYHALVIKHRDHILNSTFALDEVKISKRLTQSINRYSVRTKKDGTAAAQQPHVMIAKILHKRGQDVGEGTKIDYVCTDGSTSPKSYLPAADYTGDFDRHEMWEASVYPATQRLLEAAFPKAGWEAYERTRPPKRRGKGGDDHQTLNLFEHIKTKAKA